MRVRARAAAAAAVAQERASAPPPLLALSCAGETDADLRRGLRQLADAGVDVVTFGQYLRPTPRHMPVARYVPPAEFDGWREEALAMGFLYVAAGPLVRSSYKAGEYFLEGELKRRRMAAAAAS